MKPPSPGGRPHCGPGDGWVACRCGRRHWGLLGAAGLLVVRGNDRGAGAEVLLQHRAAWSDQGDTWGVPGGALRPGETAVAGALREAREEAGVAAESVVVRDEYVLTHPDWHYTTVLATASARIDPV
ncbi:MAG: NUDIX domain-containing protein, partial [Micrococcales bacterium]|nr:NUDIX domain-containing protein [Micrococcales bacterium]